MANSDELTRVGMEIVVQGTTLTGQILLKILESLQKLFEKKKDNRDFIINDNTKEGKQKIKDLVKKHKEGVMAIDDNVTKEQMNDYVKEFKKLGVDFSVIKNEKDSFSFFFASRDANVIEKALKNVVEKRSNNIEKKRENVSKQDNEIEGNNNKNELENSVTSKEVTPEEFAEKYYEFYNPSERISGTSGPFVLNEKGSDKLSIAHINFKNNEKTEKLSDVSLNILDYSKMIENRKSRGEVVVGLYNNNLNYTSWRLNNVRDELIQNGISKEEATKFVLNEYKEVGLLDSYKNGDLEKKVKDIINHAKQIDKSHENTTDNKLITEKKSEVKFDSKEQQLDNIFKQLSPKEQELFNQLNKANQESLDNHFADSWGSKSDKESNKLNELFKTLPEESTKKVSKLYHQNIHSGTGTEPKGKIHMDELSTVYKNLANEKQIQPQKPEVKRMEQTKNKVARPQEFSLRAVKAIDAKLKEQENKNPDKNRSKELSR